MQLWLLELLTEYYFVTEPSGSDYSSIQSARDAYIVHKSKQEEMLKDRVPEGGLIDKKQNIMIYEGQYFDYLKPDGKTVKTKAPWYGTVQNSFLERNNMNRPTSLGLGFNNWSYMERDQLGSIFGETGRIPRTDFENSGWVNPLPYGMIFLSHPHQVDFMVYLSFTYNVDVKDNQRVITRGEDGDRHHWIFCRPMGANEINNYFW